MTVIKQPCETTVAPVTRRDVLHRAADLLEEFGWCQGTYARTSGGVDVDPCDPSAAAFCAAGALGRALHDLGLIVGDEADKQGHNYLWSLDTPTTWNDAPGRTRAEVVARLRQAAEAA